MSGSVEWDHEADVVIVGSGGGGMVAALAAADAGSSSIVLEKRELIGGSTAMSGGVVWIPDNPLLAADGVHDSLEDAMAHFETVVGDVGPCSSIDRRRAFLTSGPEMVTFLQQQGVRFERCAGYSDYYSDEKGGLATGRSIEPEPWDGHQLGDLLPKLQPGLAAGVGLAVKTNEVRTLAHWNRSPRAFGIATRVILRTWAAKARRRQLLTNGAALIGQMLHIARDRGVPVWTDCPVTDLVVEEDRVVGVRATRDGRPIAVRARQGVLLAAGGFSHNAEMRREHAPDRRQQPRWSIANPGDTGDALQAAMSARRPDGSHGRGLVAPHPEGWQVRPIDARRRTVPAWCDLRRCRRAAVRQRGQLVHGDRPGDVRARSDGQGSAVLADLRRRLPAALLPRPVQARQAPEGPDRKRDAQAGRHHRFPRRGVRHRAGRSDG